MLKQKDMRRTDWHRILRREYRYAPCSYQGMQGIASVLILQEVAEPLIVRYGTIDLVVAEAGNTWLQVAFRDAYFWASAMFDRDDQLLQIYFDMTDGNHLEDETNPTFEDLYLDVVLEADGVLQVLDRDELDEACEMGEITEEQYRRTIHEGEKLVQYLAHNGQAFVDFCYRQMIKLKNQ